MTARIKITRVTDGDEIATQLVPRMEALGQAVGARMQRLVPKRTWALHDTIATTTERVGSKVVTNITAGSGSVDYALHVERGTSRMAAQPYMRPALAQSRAGDLEYTGRGIVSHGVISISSRRQRLRKRGSR